MNQRLDIDTLPQSSLAASAAFMTEYLGQANSLLAAPQTRALTIVLPAASADHDDWRRALALDMARAAAPKRVNIIGADAGDKREALLQFLGSALGVTGQYCPAHD